MIIGAVVVVVVALHAWLGGVVGAALAPSVGSVSADERNDWRGFGYNWGVIGVAICWLIESLRNPLDNGCPVAWRPGDAGAHSRAGFLPRFAGAIVDGLLLGAFTGIMLLLFGVVGYVISVIAGIAYTVTLIGGPRGQTLGQRATGLKVVSRESGESIGYSRALGRYIIGQISSVFLLLVYVGRCGTATSKHGMTRRFDLSS